MKLTIAEVKRRLPVGKKFIAEWCGKMNKDKPDARTTRVVSKQGAVMVSEFLSGSNQGKTIDLNWRGVSAREENGNIVLSLGEEDFLKIEIVCHDTL
jgi:hypothetical protein